MKSDDNVNQVLKDDGIKYSILEPGHKYENLTKNNIKNVTAAIFPPDMSVYIMVYFILKRKINRYLAFCEEPYHKIHTGLFVVPGKVSKALDLFLEEVF